MPRKTKKADAAELALVHGDGWSNILSGHGIVGKDRRLASSFMPDQLDYQQLQQLYRGNDVAVRIVEEEPGAMVRAWLKVLVGEDADATSALKVRMEELGVRDLIETAMNWARAYGGAAIILGADDGQRDLRLPLNLKGIRTLDWLTAMDCSEIQVASWYENPRAPKYGEPKTFRLVPKLTGDMPADQMGNMELHESRVVPFQGVVTDREQLRANLYPGWGDSVLCRPNRILRDFDMGWDSVAAILTEFAIATYGIEGLASLVATRQDSVVKKRVELIMQQKSVLRGVLMDAKESFKRETVPLGGVADILDRFSKRMAAAANMPVTVMMGESPAGLNATGAGETRNWYDRIAAKRPRALGRPLERILVALFAAQNGPTKGKTPEDWTIEYEPLWQLTAQEEADLRNKQSATDKAYVDMGAVTAEEVAVSRFPKEGYNASRMVIDLELREGILSNLTEEDLKPPPPPALDPNAPKPPKKGGPGEGGATEDPADDPEQEMGKRQDFDPSQDRDENGMWTASGGSAGGPKSEGGKQYLKQAKSIRARAEKLRAEGKTKEASDVDWDTDVHVAFAHSNEANFLEESKDPGAGEAHKVAAAAWRKGGAAGLDHMKQRSGAHERKAASLKAKK